MLVVDDVFSGYGKSQVLHGVSLSVNEGEIVALIGANGAGKTTLLKTISGLLQTQSGTIRFQNTEIQNLSAHRIVESGVSQVAEGRAMLKRMTVLENLRIGAHVRKDKEIRQDIDQIFSKFPVLGERQDQLAGLLSGGEQQMLAIGRALMARPRILLLDEPSLGLAPMVVTEIFRTLHALRDDETTIFLVEQNARRALQVADRGYVLERGQIALEGTGQRLLDDETIQQTNLGKRASQRTRCCRRADTHSVK